MENRAFEVAAEELRDALRLLPERATEIEPWLARALAGAAQKSGDKAMAAEAQVLVDRGLARDPDDVNLDIARSDLEDARRKGITLPPFAGRLALLVGAAVMVFLVMKELRAEPITVTSLEPAFGAPGTWVEVRGSGFDESTDVVVGGVKAEVVFYGPDHLGFTVPPGAQDGVVVRQRGSVATVDFDAWR